MLGLQVDAGVVEGLKQQVAILQQQCEQEGALGRNHIASTGRGPPRERRVPPAGVVAEVIREKGPTRVQIRCRRRPPYPVPSNGPPSAPATDTAPWSKRKKAPSSTDAVRHSGIGPPPPKKNLEACRTPSLRRRGEEGDCSPSRGTCPAV
ncbi:unnamed protein product [Pleuronectes platessa]|uniref:Uncharacterized protein n=1 Tax=Pleuronectes platessa TaxID=8262 RepID=A0A9N7YID1_PLEPL|nr:unnamed protein product [Pleuronectes platessa]